MTVNMGPQHPSTHGVFRLVLEIDGEVVVSAKPTIGYLHTGIEKTAEQKKWQQVIPLVERMDYLGAQSNSFAFALSVEKLLGLEMPDRVKWIRILLVELQRINSHLVWLGTHAMDLGAVSVMLYCFRERELILNINEMIAGFRMFPSYIRVGGLREDLPRGFHEAVRALLERLPGKLQDYEDLLTKNTIFLNRTQGVGTFTLEQCYAYGLVGPMARAAGSTYDVRKAFPYARLRHLRFRHPRAPERRRVRPLPGARRRDAAEHPHLPAGDRPHLADRHLPGGRSARGAAAEGQGLHGDGSAHPALPDLLAGLHGAEGRGVRADRGPARRARHVRRVGRHEPPVRVHLRPASFYACQAMPPMVVGGLIADVVAVIGSTDIVMGDVDR